MFFGSVCGAFLLPALFASWLAITLDHDFAKIGNDFGRRKRSVDDLLVVTLFAAWLTGIMFGYTSYGIQGAIAMSLCVGTLSGAFLSYWLLKRKFS